MNVSYNNTGTAPATGTGTGTEANTNKSRGTSKDTSRDTSAPAGAAGEGRNSNANAAGSTDNSAQAGSTQGRKKGAGMLRPYATLFALALITALLARAGLLIMDMTGALSYDYISASNVPILDVICSILTGSAFVAFLFVSGLALVISTAGVALYGLLFAQRAQRGDLRGRAFKAFLAGWATALVALVCALIVVSGILSAVQIGSMSSKLPALPMLCVALVVFAAFLGTLLGAASLTVCACIARAKAGGCIYINLIVAAALCGLPVMILTVGTFAAINTSLINLPTLGLWFGADITVNIVIMVIASILIKRAGRRMPAQGA